MEESQPSPDRIAAIYARVSTDNQRLQGTVASQVDELARARSGPWLCGRPGARVLRRGSVGGDACAARAGAVARRRGGRDPSRWSCAIRPIVSRVATPIRSCSSRSFSRGNRGHFRVRRRARRDSRGRAAPANAGHDRRVRAGPDPRAHAAGAAVRAPGKAGRGPCRAPYGYRYVRRSEHADAYFEIDEAKAPVVREIFRRYAHEAQSLAAIADWLNETATPTTTAGKAWHRLTVRGMLVNPAYRAEAAFGKTRVTGVRGKATRRARQRGARESLAPQRTSAPEDSWSMIAVPAIIDADTFALARSRLEQGVRFASRNAKRPSLLRGLLVCRECGYAVPLGREGQAALPQGLLPMRQPLPADRRAPLPEQAGARRRARPARLGRDRPPALRSRHGPRRDPSAATGLARDRPERAPQ